MIRKQSYIFISLMLLIGGMLFAQKGPNKKVIKLSEKANEAIKNQDFINANACLAKIFQIDTTYAEAYIMQADIYNFSLKSDQAADYYNKALQLIEKPKPALYFITAGEELKCGRYQEALTHFETYLEKVNFQTPLYEEIQKGIATCKFGIEAMKNPVIFDLVNLGPNINSEWDEYLAALTADEMEFIFTVSRPRDEKTVCAFCLMEEDFYYSKKENNEWQPRLPLGKPINTSYNEGAQCISPDGRYLFYTWCNTDFGLGSCDLYWSKRIGNRWSRPRNFGEPVNTERWESQPSIASDGKTLYFASNRPGGFGGFDIWKTKMIEEGVFTVPENLGSVINTKGDDTAPFIHSDGRTLYFASDGHPGMGGIDLYYSLLLGDSSWSEPVNLGYPINTPSDEVNIIINPSGTTAYISSDKEGGYGGLDLYYFTLDERIRPTPVTYIKGKIKDAESQKPLEAKIELVDLNQNQTITSTSSDPETGEFLACILTGTNVLLNVTHPYYPFYSENFQLKKSYSELAPFIKDISLRKAEVGTTFILSNIFFDFNKSELKSESFVELDNLVHYLKKNGEIKIEIGGHTDNQGTDEYNNKLSLERAKSVYDYLISRGISPKQISYKGYGKSKPIASNDTEEGRAINRRTEFMIVE
ncbi:MAG: OmpA family protein [Bacteroidales bacterium]